MSPAFVYLIECQSGRIKVGCSNDPHLRAEMIGRGASHPVRLIAMWPGDIAQEQSLHRRYADCRKYREWFDVHGEFSEFVVQMRGHGVRNIADWPVFGGPDAIERERERRRRQSETLRAQAAAKRLAKQGVAA